MNSFAFFRYALNSFVKERTVYFDTFKKNNIRGHISHNAPEPYDSHNLLEPAA